MISNMAMRALLLFCVAALVSGYVFGQNAESSITMESLVARSDLIIEGDVQAIYPSVMYPGPTNIKITDSLIIVRRVLKANAPKDPEKVIVTHSPFRAGPTTTPAGVIDPFQPGQRYVFFLTKAPKGRDDVLPKRDYPRYDAWGMRYGVFQVKGDVLVFPRLAQRQLGEGAWAVYDGSSKNRVHADVSGYTTPGSQGF